MGLELEQRLRAAAPLAARRVDRRLNLELTGGMAPYQWFLNGRVYENREPLMVAEGERVEIVMGNKTAMAHPMHLHGHVFQVVALDGKPLEGALRDTVMVPPRGSVTIAFDADNPGRWAFHCHNLYHMAVGMFTSLEYEG
ncbi:MAG: multicopper oxidase domain-containing protein [Kiloniellaceae bacterium]